MCQTLFDLREKYASLLADLPENKSEFDTSDWTCFNLYTEFIEDLHCPCRFFSPSPDASPA